MRDIWSVVAAPVWLDGVVFDRLSSVVTVLVWLDDVVVVRCCMPEGRSRSLKAFFEWQTGGGGVICTERGAVVINSAVLIVWHRSERGPT